MHERRYTNLIKSLSIKSQFPIFAQAKYQTNPLVFFDNGATTLKPQMVIDRILDYYTKTTSNNHSTDYQLAFKVDKFVEETRALVGNFFNCPLERVIFTSGTTMAINQVCYGLKDQFNHDDEIVIGNDSHTSLSLPCYRLAKQTNAKLKIVNLTSCANDINSLVKNITSKTRLFALTAVNNLLGHSYDLKKIGEYIKQNYPRCYFLVDAAQASAHVKIDMLNSYIDFLAVSAHKMYGPTGIGALLASEKIAELDPVFVGGNMNDDVFADGSFTYKIIPYNLEAGTANLAGIFGFAAAIKFLQTLDFSKVHALETNLKQYALSCIQKSLTDNIKIYNLDTNFHIVFNIKNVFAQDVASYLGSKNICVRSGDHCAKLVNYTNKINPSVRVTFGVYNDFDDVDLLVKALLAGGDFLGEFFE